MMKQATMKNYVRKKMKQTVQERKTGCFLGNQSRNQESVKSVIKNMKYTKTTL